MESLISSMGINNNMGDVLCTDQDTNHPNHIIPETYDFESEVNAQPTHLAVEDTPKLSIEYGLLVTVPGSSKLVALNGTNPSSSGTIFVGDGKLLVDKGVPLFSINIG